MAISQFDIDLALLSALVNGNMSLLNPDRDNVFDAASGYNIGNLIHTGAPPILGQSLVGINGWSPIEVRFSAITNYAPNVTQYSDLGGLAAAAFKNGTQGVISFRGTEVQVPDWLADASLTLGGIPQQLYAAYYYTKAAIDALHAQGVTTITFTGHSLGGALASAMARYFGGEAVVFDAAPNRGSAINLADGAGPLYAGYPVQNILFPAIPASGAPASHVRLYFSEHDPISQAVGDAGGGRLGDASDVSPDSAMFDLNADKTFFTDAQNRVSLITDWALNDPAISLHSMHLVLLQMLLSDKAKSNGVYNNRLGDASAGLVDLMTQVFNDEVNLREQIGRSLGVGGNVDQTRYDIFLRQMVDDKLNHGGHLVDTWLDDLDALGGAQGRLREAGLGTEGGIKDTPEWQVMRSLIQAATQFAAQESITHAPPTRIIQNSGGVITADLSKILNDLDGTSSDGRHLAARDTLMTGLYQQSYLPPELVHGGYLVVDAGGAAATTLTGGNGLSFLIGFDGDDTLNAGTGATSFYGGDGKDTASMAAYGRGVTVALSSISSGGNSWGAVFAQSTVLYGAIHYSVENVIGTAFDDRITGNDKENKLEGGTGADKLFGQIGADELTAGGVGGAAAGFDELTGGDDRDSFIVADKAKIIDLQVGESVTFEGTKLGSVIEKNDSGAFVKDGLTYDYAGGVLTVSGAKGSITISGESGPLGQHELWKVGSIVGRDKDDDSNSDIHDKIGGGGLLDTAGLDKSSPLVFDLDGDGIELISRAASTAFFDLDQDGLSERVGWVKADDGLLAWDKNSNGKIDDSGELFGTKTTDGYTVLRALDSNSDGAMTSLDTNWSNLRIWRDANQNGIAEASELKTLATTGITSISVMPTLLAA